jgi:hypothetical protein
MRLHEKTYKPRQDVMQGVSCLSGCFSRPQYVGVGFGWVPWNGPPALHVHIGHGLVLGQESQHGLEGRHRLLAPTMARDDFIKIGLVQLAAHGTRARFSETLGAACPHTTNWGLLKQPDKHEASRQIIQTNHLDKTSRAGVAPTLWFLYL